jgi:DNA polymerase I-like protein with 3'-5' exonuclease and polymerase domains
MLDNAPVPTGIAILGTPEDRPFLPRLQELVGARALKVSLSSDEYAASIGAKCKAHNLCALIVTCPVTMLTLLKCLPDFRRPLNKNGSFKVLTLDDYSGSFFSVPGTALKLDRDIDVLILNPLKHFVSTAEGTFIARRFVSKITKPETWFQQTAFSWEVWTPSKSQAILERFSQARLLSVDIETYRDDPERRIHCVGYCALFPDGTTHTVVVPFKCMIAHGFVRALNSTSVPKLFQNGMYDNAYFARWNVPCEAWFHDTQHLFHSWYAELPKRLDFITAFAVRRVRYWKDDSAGDEYNLFEYNAKDCWATLNAYLSLISEAPQWAKDNYNTEFPLVFPCLHMELDGLRVDKAIFERNKAEAEEKLKVVAKPLAAWFGPKFNPGSSDQVKRLLTVLGMGKDIDSSDAKALNACAAAHPFNEKIVSAILAYRKQAKLLSTYFKWEKFWNDRLYYKTNPAGTESGRLASTESSFWCGLQIQNIPGGKAVKDWIGCDPGWDGLGEGDYSQSEARCVGYLSGCLSLIALVESDKDYHKWNAHKFFGVAYDAVDKPLRDLSKRVNHGSNYNMGAAVLLDTMGPKKAAEARILLKLPSKWTLIQVCQHLLDTYAQTYPEVKRDWYDDIKRKIKMTKKLVSALGWTRHFFADPTSSKPALNAAVAHGPQNLSAAIINQRFYSIWHASVYGDLRDKVRLKANIHDSIFFAYRGAETPAIVQERMRNPIQVTDIKGVTRTMLIPVDMNAGGMYWSALK